MRALRNRHLFVLDVVLLAMAGAAAFFLRLDSVSVKVYYPGMALFIAVAVPIELLVAQRLGVYRCYWRYASVDELVLLASAAAISTIATAALYFGVAMPLTGVYCPRSVPLINGLLMLLLMSGVRIGVRMAWLSEHRRQSGSPPEGRQRKRVLVVGAGNAGSLFVQQMRANPSLGLVPVGFVDS